jgi:formylglycine-generating enzyme required for sulfatase activity
VAVGANAPNAWGLYDMHGNVREWCLDGYQGYSAGAVSDPFAGAGLELTVRGGSWALESEKCRSALREGNSAVLQANDMGFRVVLAEVIALVPNAALGMVLIPAGTFDMGSSAGNWAPYYGSSSTQPVHSVTISQDFFMGEHEVTQAEYQAMMGTNPSSFSGVNRPVESVTWYDARAYCTARTAQEMALGNVPSGMEYRLPTEAEWEYACRAGTTTEFNVGADLYCADARFVYSFHSNSSCSSSSTVDVGGYSANAFGLYDMHGNVWEWCLDSYAGYSSGAATDPFVTGGSNRVLRGGSWTSNSGSCRSAYRNNFSPGGSGDGLGFRVVLASVLVP